jgi:peptidoglycan/LPS O-acetylase OafA/YrhL
VSKRLPQLDAIRGLAILTVILHNQRDQFPALHLSRLFDNGWMGVDLFFVLSGFLITGILVDTRQAPGYFTKFYARRCLRIWPLYYSVLFFMFVVVPLFRPAEGYMVFERSSPWWGYPLFLQNFLVPIPTSATGPLAVSWSLAVEEQFYLVWPWVIRYCSDGQIRRIALWVICTSPALRFLLSFYGVHLYSNTFCRLDGLMAGAVLAVAVRSGGFEPSRFVTRAWIALVVTIPSVFAAQALDLGWLVFSLSAAACAAFVYLTLFSRNRVLQVAMTNRFVVYTGTISYGLYLLHKIPFDMAKGFHLDGQALIALPVLLSATYVVSALSWNWLEKPFLDLKRHFATKPFHSQAKGREIVLAS